ncbi:SurA N-terminal domain-containing protein [Pseudohalioglobus lutimaris]|uniref:Periplasmic chaperone PpiD n=1 Tax=Pseudohalioglobus lutimaris TaxID=1737061 RepID=A0A2N5X337_9GAMM|nr:SurA N-terminal domain-containing protein [Pseudohalioglobus lutimaris]PLW68902.1 peptidylprolyl isomerase [Pseudohalioglobus lutimaris]
MLQDIRANAQGTVAKVIVGLIVIAFSLFGIESILLGGSTNAVAEVNGEEIGPQELQQAVNTQKRQLLAMMGDDIRPELLDDELLSQQAMQSLIQRKLLVQSAQNMGLTISDAQVGAIVGGMEEFQLDGQFSAEMYRARLADAGFTPTSFKQAMSDDLIMGQVRSGLAASEFATPAEMELNARVAGEQRDLRYLTIPMEKFSAAGEVSDADVQAYYAENSQQFLAEETVTLDYIQLRAEDFIQPVDEQVILEAYEAETRVGQYATENRVAHILFEQEGEESAEAFQQRIAEVTARLEAGDDFAELAAEFSDDVGSRAFGGELGFTSGDTFPEAMEEAISSMEVGQISSPVETEAGTHLILLQERREGVAPSLDELRPRLEEQIALSEARVELLRTVETLKDLSFNADNLNEPAQELGLEVAGAERISRNQSDGLFANTLLLDAAFTEDVLNAGHNSDVIEIDQNTWVVLRVREHFPTEVMPLEQVREQIVAAIVETRARAAVEAAATDVVKALRAGDSVEEVAVSSGYEWQVELAADRRNPVLPRELLSGAFQLAPPEEGASVIEYVLTNNGDALVYEVARVTPGALDALPEAERTALQQMVGGEYGQLVDNEYRQGLRDTAEINIL